MSWERFSHGLLAATSYKEQQDGQALLDIVGHLQQIRALHHVALDILYSAEIALDAAHPNEQAT